MAGLKSSLRGLYHRFLSSLPDKTSLKLQYFKNNRRLPNLDQPTTFSEKCLHRKIHEDNDLFVQLSDKVLVKQIVAGKIGPQYVTPTIWSGKSLPNGQRWPAPVVVKANHASGSNIFVLDDDTADWDEIRRTTEGWLSKSWKPYLRERWYDRIDRQVLIEPFIGTGGQPPIDYKMFTFNGRVEVIQVDTDRFIGHRRALFGREWEMLDVGLEFEREMRPVERPKSLELMIDLAEKLAKGIAFVRVDFYELDGVPRFGEMTFAPGGGVERFSPSSYDRKLGDLWTGPTT